MSERLQHPERVVRLAAWLTLLLAACPAAGQLQVLVLAYFYPVGNPYWSELTSAAGRSASPPF
jgi:hypothetical protein